MLSIFKMASKIVKINSYKAEFFLNSDWLNLVLADQSEVVSFSAELIVQSNLVSPTSSDIGKVKDHLILAHLVHNIIDLVCLRMASAVSAVLQQYLLVS